MQTTPELLRTIADLQERYGDKWWRQVLVNYVGGWFAAQREEDVWARIYEESPSELAVKPETITITGSGGSAEIPVPASCYFDAALTPGPRLVFEFGRHPNLHPYEDAVREALGFD